MITRITYSNRPYYLILLVVSAVFLTAFSTATSFIAQDYPTDSTNFIVMGKMFLEGKVPFQDFFDHKGPSLILIEAVAQLVVPYRLGAFLFQLLNLFLVLVVIWKMSCIVLSRFQSLGVAAFLLLFIKYVFSGGNSSEEFSFLPTFIVYLFLANVFFVNEKLRERHFFVIGLCFSFLFWLRLNNALPIVVVCIYLFADYLLRKDYQSLKRLFIYFFLGQVPFSLLYLGYFMYHGAVYDLMYASFLFNISYVKSFVGFDAHFIRINVIQLFLLSIGTVCYFLKTKDYKVFLLSFLILFITFFSTNVGGGGMDHYYMNAGASFVWALLLILFGINKSIFRNALAVLVLFALVRIFAYGMATALFEQEFRNKRAQESLAYYHTMYNIIPEDEKNKVYFYDLPSSVYILLNINSNYKYFILQEWMGTYDDNIWLEINKMMKSTPPLWVVLRKPYLVVDKYQNVGFVDILEQDYVVRYEDEIHTVLMLDPKSSSSYPCFRTLRSDRVMQ